MSPGRKLNAEVVLWLFVGASALELPCMPFGRCCQRPLQGSNGHVVPRVMGLLMGMSEKFL